MLKLVDLAAKKILLITPTLDINPCYQLAVPNQTMANRRSPLRLTYVEPVLLGYDRYLSHLSAQPLNAQQRFRPPFLLVAHYGVLQYFVHECSPYTLTTAVRRLQWS